MTRRVFSIIVVFCIIIGVMTLPVNASESGECEAGILWEISGDNVLTITGQGEMEDGDFPWMDNYKDTIEKVVIGEGIKSVADYAFYSYNALAEVVLPSTLEYIGALAFGDTKIQNITFPDGVKTIEEQAFYNTYVENIDIPESVNYIGYSAFADCESLITVTGGEGIEEIKPGAFYGTPYFENEENRENGYLYLNTILLDADYTVGVVQIKDGTTIIAGDAFSSLQNVGDVVIPSSVISIDESAFQGCRFSSITFNEGLEKICYSAFRRTNLTNVSFPDTLKEIDDSAFAECSALKSVTFGDGIKKIGEEAFKGADISAIVLPQNIDSVEMYAFSGNKNLSSVDLGGVKFIASCAFKDASKIESLIIPDTVEVMHGGAFENCTALKTLVLGEKMPYVYDAFAGCEAVETVTVRGEWTTELSCFPNLKTLVLGDNFKELRNGLHSAPTSLENITFGKGVQEITSESMRKLVNLKSITISDSTLHIGVNAFENTAYYKNPENWENGVLYIGNHLIKATDVGNSYVVKEGTVCIADQAFVNDSRLKNISFPTSLKSIGSLAFHYNTALDNVVIPDGVTHIYNSAFHECYGLKNITIPDSVCIIEQYAFKNTPAYRDADNWENGVLYLGNHALEYDSSLTDNGVVEIREGTLTVAGSAFAGSDCTDIVLPESILYINDSAFDYCQNLTNINFEKNLTYIGRAAFSSTNLGEVIIPPSVNVIGRNAFEYCKNLTKAEISAKYLEEYSFSSCDNLTDVTFFEGVETIGYNAFGWTPVKEIILPNSVKKIDESFYGCTSLEKVSLGRGIADLGGAFLQCETISVLEIPVTLRSVAQEAFYNIEISDVYYAGTEEEWNNINFEEFNENITELANIHFNYRPEPAIKTISVSEPDDNGDIFVTLELEGGREGGMIIPVVQDVSYSDNYTIENSGPNMRFKITGVEKGNAIKLFWWSDLINLKPLCLSVDVNI